MNEVQADPRQLSGRNRRLWHEWRKMEEWHEGHPAVRISVLRKNAQGLPVAYLVAYRLKSICGVENIDQIDDPRVENPPVFATDFLMRITIPENYPCVDGMPEYRFLTADEQGRPIPHPWHPNIRYFGAFAGRVCLNPTDTFTDIAWGVERIASYLRYERYHAIVEPPYPEDLKVAAWVTRQGEPNAWIYFDQTD